jgi:oxygen-independent coproporphyrinogen-3 oxidase
LCEKLPERWHARVASEGHGTIERDDIDPGEAAREHLLMNLRLAEGLDLETYRARWGIAPDAARIDALVAGGFLTRLGTAIAATPRGLLVLNRVIADLI